MQPTMIWVTHANVQSMILLDLLDVRICITTSEMSFRPSNKTIKQLIMKQHDTLTTAVLTPFLKHTSMEESEKCVQVTL